MHLLKARAQGAPAKEIQVIERQSHHLVRLVDDLLDVARLTRGTLELHREPTELARVVALAVETVGPLVAQRRHSLAVDVAAAGLLVDADLSRLSQVFSNLLNNAAHYTEPGGRLAVTAVASKDAVVVEVSDDGPGIPDEAKSEIFGLFVRGAKHRDARGGLGLGLVVVRQLTELHGGTVTVANGRGGRGSTFSVRLPLAATPPPTTPEPASAPAAVEPVVRRRVLLVDDNKDALDLLAAYLEGEGHEVQFARDGLEALALLDRARPEVAVLDLGMPVMDGCELAARIRARGDVDPPRLVALTGYGQAVDRERTRAAGIDEHLVKPVDLRELSRAITRGRPAR